MGNKWTIGNIVYLVNALVLVLAFMTMGIKAATAQDLRADTIPQERTYNAHERVRLATADPVDRQLARYSRLIPELGFLRIYGNKGAAFVSRLPGLLGNGAVNMDYSHDETLRQDLVDLQLYRITKMVEKNEPSATLFKLGKDSAFDHRYLCVVTINTRPFQHNPNYATRFMTSAIKPGLSLGRTKPYIRNEDFLRFTVDHEVFHCLNAYFNGAPFQSTSNTLKSHYEHYLNESKADAYASLMSNQARDHKKEFLARLSALRTQSLAAMDTFHASSDVIDLASRVCLDVGLLEPEEVVHIATKLVNENSPGISDYGKYLATMIGAIERLGGDGREIRKDLDIASLPRPDEIKVTTLVARVQAGRRLIIGEKSESEVAAPGSGPQVTQFQNDPQTDTRIANQ